MIRTNYNALGNYTFDTKSRAYEGVSRTSASETIGNINTRKNDVAVILTLSSQSNSAELNASRTVAAKTTSSSSVLKMGSKGAKVKELQKNLTKLGYDTNGIDEMKFIVPTAAGHLLSGCVIV